MALYISVMTQLEEKKTFFISWIFVCFMIKKIRAMILTWGRELTRCNVVTRWA